MVEPLVDILWWLILLSSSSQCDLGCDCECVICFEAQERQVWPQLKESWLLLCSSWLQSMVSQAPKPLTELHMFLELSGRISEIFWVYTLRSENTDNSHQLEICVRGVLTQLMIWHLVTFSIRKSELLWCLPLSSVIRIYIISWTGHCNTITKVSVIPENGGILQQTGKLFCLIRRATEGCDGSLFFHHPSSQVWYHRRVPQCRLLVLM